MTFFSTSSKGLFIGRQLLKLLGKAKEEEKAASYESSRMDVPRSSTTR